MAFMKVEELFIEAVRNSLELPGEVRSRAGLACGINLAAFDPSYLQFLDQQIQMNTRGAEWAAIYRRRLAGLTSLAGRSLVSGHIRYDSFSTWIKVDPNTRSVVYWEQLQDDVGA
ncbi:MAG TPA: hypothetical protein VF607_05275 [Verrucomicrobiae bacterium]